MSSFTRSFGDDLGSSSAIPPLHDDDGHGDYGGGDYAVDNNKNASSSPKEYDEEEDEDEDVRVGGLTAEQSGNGPILPPPIEMEPEEGFPLTEWRRENAKRLEEKEKREKEILRNIIEDADEYKAEFYRKSKLRCENSRASNREKEKLFLESQEKFHAEASKNYWKTIAELIPKEVPTIEMRGGKKDQEKKPSIVVIQGPKPGKPTDLARMRQILVKLKHKPPPHVIPPLPLSDSSKEAKTSQSSSASAPKPSGMTPSDTVASS